MIQTFVPRGRLTPYMGKGNLKSISLATIFGAASSSCSFAALAAARALVMVNAKYYGWRVSLYIAVIMFASIVATALAMHYGFGFLGITPESSRRFGSLICFLPSS